MPLLKKQIQKIYKLPAFWLLIILVTLAYLPFLNIRVLRMAGDEKVYLTQAVEMAREGRWFVQTMADVPNYFKGPLHYILIHVGLTLFGNHLIAGLYMNWLFALLAGLSLFFLARKRWSQESALLLGVAGALNVGIFSHAFASQMEVELCGLYALALACLGLAPTKKVSLKYDLTFWITAGITGWVKSPLHSVLVGCGGLFFWLLQGSLWLRLRSPQAWVSVIAGVAVGSIGYAPAYFLDKENFLRDFLGRENFEKPDNGRHWDYVLRSLPHFALPWTAVTVLGFFRGLQKIFHKKHPDRDMLFLGLGFSLPTLVFFCFFPYKGQNYNLPTMAGLLLTAWAAFGGVAPRWSHRFTAFVGILALFIFIGILTHFWPLPHWWCLSWIVLTLLCLCIFCAIFAFATRERSFAIGTLFFFLTFAFVIIPLGKREMIDIKSFMKDHPELTYHYYNLEQTIWSEWALLQLTLHHPIYGLHWEKQIPETLQPGHAILVSGQQALDSLETKIRTLNIDLNNAKRTPWTRWLTKGVSSTGESRWKQAWRTRDLRVLEREFYILWIPRN